MNMDATRSGLAVRAVPKMSLQRLEQMRAREQRNHALRQSFSRRTRPGELVLQQQVEPVATSRSTAQPGQLGQFARVHGCRRNTLAAHGGEFPQVHRDPELLRSRAASSSSRAASLTSDSELLLNNAIPLVPSNVAGVMAPVSW